MGAQPNPLSHSLPRIVQSPTLIRVAVYGFRASGFRGCLGVEGLGVGGLGFRV